MNRSMETWYCTSAQVALSRRIVRRDRFLAISTEWCEQLFLIARKSEPDIHAVGPDHQWDMPTGA